MFTLTRLLLPFLDIDSMAAWLETCKEAHGAFLPTRLPKQQCKNRGLAERCGVIPVPYIYNFRWNLDQLPYWIYKSEPALLALIYKHHPRIWLSLEYQIDQILLEHNLIRHYQMSYWAKLVPTENYWDGQTFRFQLVIQIRHMRFWGEFPWINLDLEI